jgi:hypothetical protein
MWSATQVRNGRAVHVVRNAAAKVNLVVILHDVNIVDEHQLGDEGCPLQRPRSIEIGNVANDQVRAVDSHGKALLAKAAKVVVTTGQFLKH